MAALTADQLTLLKRALADDYVPHLPKLTVQNKNADDIQNKNLSRALSAFAVHKLCGTSIADACASVVDDFEDAGIDAIFFDANKSTLFIIQTKLVAGKQFKEDEALKLCEGVRKLVHDGVDDFNEHVRKRQVEIEQALEDCAKIQLVVAHVGDGISGHARDRLVGFTTNADNYEKRFAAEYIDFGPERVLADLNGHRAQPKVDTKLKIMRAQQIADPRVTYFGLVWLKDLVALHQKHGDVLFDKNIRNFLGPETDVNKAICATLTAAPETFVYLNNGVTALSHEVEQGRVKDGSTSLRLRGFSVINGAQTIASASAFASGTPPGDISKAKVTFTVIKADANGEFCKTVTYARNHQNQVANTTFAALDDQQEALRRSIALLGLKYSYKADTPAIVSDPSVIRIEAAAIALALLDQDPRVPVKLSRGPGDFLKIDSDEYKGAFTGKRSPFEVVNAVRAYRYIAKRMQDEADKATGQDRLIYKHCGYVHAWVLMKRLRQSIQSAALLDEVKIAKELSKPFDDLRDLIATETKAVAVRAAVGPKAIMANQTEVVHILEMIAIAHYGVPDDAALTGARGSHQKGDQYPKALFRYLASKAPQIGNLS